MRARGARCGARAGQGAAGRMARAERRNVRRDAIADMRPRDLEESGAGRLICGRGQMLWPGGQDVPQKQSSCGERTLS